MGHDEERLNEYFGKYSEVLQAAIMMDKVRERLMGGSASSSSPTFPSSTASSRSTSAPSTVAPVDQALLHQAMDMEQQILMLAMVLMGLVSMEVLWLGIGHLLMGGYGNPNAPPAGYVSGTPGGLRNPWNNRVPTGYAFVGHVGNTPYGTASTWNAPAGCGAITAPTCQSRA